MKIQSFKILYGKAFVAQIVILLLVLLVIGCGAIFYINTRDRVINTEVTSEQLELLTKEWKTYTNEKFGYEMKYPMSWNMSENIIYVNHEDWVFCPSELTSPGGECEPKDTIGHMPDTLAPILFFQSAISEADSKNPAHKVLGKKDGYKYSLVLANPLFEKEFNIMALTFQFKSSKIAPSPTPASTIKVPSITVLSPNGGEVWQKGTYQTISWDVPEQFKGINVDITFMKYYPPGSNNYPTCSGCATYGVSYLGKYNIVKNVNIDRRSYEWVVGDNTNLVDILPGQYYIQICESAKGGLCNANRNVFSIVDEKETSTSIKVISPNGGEQLASGSIHQIKWNYPNATSTSKVDLYLVDPGSGYHTCTRTDYPCPPSFRVDLDRNILANTTYSWIVGTDIVNNVISPGYYVMKICIAGTNDCDVSNKTFEITSLNSSPRIEPIVLPNSPVTSYYSQDLEVFGFSTSTVNWQIVSGSLPPGLHIQNQYVTCLPMFPSNCPHIDIVMFKARISGKSTQAGNYNFTIKASNDIQSVTKTYSLNLY